LLAAPRTKHWHTRLVELLDVASRKSLGYELKVRQGAVILGGTGKMELLPLLVQQRGPGDGVAAASSPHARLQATT